MNFWLFAGHGVYRPHREAHWATKPKRPFLGRFWWPDAACTLHIPWVGGLAWTRRRPPPNDGGGRLFCMRWEERTPPPEGSPRFAGPDAPAGLLKATFEAWERYWLSDLAHPHARGAFRVPVE